MKRVLSIAALAMLLIGRVEAPAADFNGDGTGDIAIFRASSGLWAIRAITRLYFGKTGDLPIPYDWEGAGNDLPAIFRPSTGLWALQGFSRVYFGTLGDEPKPGDYNGDGSIHIGIFRPSSGLWAVRGITRVYFGTSGDYAITPNVARSSLRGGSLLQTGQHSEYTSGDDGTYQAGIDFSYQTADPDGNGEIVTIDNITGLVWATNGNDEGCFNGQSSVWLDAINYCNNLDYAGYEDWRLPNRRELESLINAGKSSPAINEVYLTNTKSSSYWTSTSHYSLGSYAWTVDFSYGNTWFSSKFNTRYIRAVRDGLE